MNFEVHEVRFEDLNLQNLDTEKVQNEYRIKNAILKGVVWRHTSLRAQTGETIQNIKDLGKNIWSKIKFDTS